jgi:hypothetical protein
MQVEVAKAFMRKSSKGHEVWNIQARKLVSELSACFTKVALFSRTQTLRAREWTFNMIRLGRVCLLRILERVPSCCLERILLVVVPYTEPNSQVAEPATNDQCSKIATMVLKVTKIADQSFE